MNEASKVAVGPPPSACTWSQRP